MSTPESCQIGVCQTKFIRTKEGSLIQPTVGFIVYGVHKDGLKDPMGVPFIDDAIVERSKKALTQAGLKIVEHEIVIASKKEARSR